MGVVDDVYTYLETHGEAGGSTDWTLLRRRVMDAPAFDQLVVVQEDGGVPPEIHKNSGMGDSALAEPGVLITVRAEAADGDAGFAKAESIRELLHGILSQSLVTSGTVYFAVRALTPEPIFAGYDDRGRPLHTVAFRLLRAV